MIGDRLEPVTYHPSLIAFSLIRGDTLAEKTTEAEIARVLGLEGKEVKVGEETLTIMPFKFGQLPAVLKHIGTLTGASGGDFDIVKALTEGSEEVLGCLAIAAGKPRAWFDTIEIDEGVALLQAVMEVNEDLFKKKLLPLLTGMARKAGAGQSSVSSLPGTRLKKSKRIR